MNSESNDVKGKVMFGLCWKFGERIIAQLITLLVSIILARLLSPHDYGAVAMIMIFITIANVFVSSGFGSALIQKKDADNLDFSSVFYINIFVSIAIYVLLFFAAPYIASFYDMPILSSALRVLAIRIPVAAINSVQQAYVSRHMLFKRFFWSTLFGTLISGIVGVYMAYCGYGIWALVAQYLTNTCVDTIVLWITVKWRPILKCSWQRAKGLLSYGWKLLVSGLLDTGYNELRKLIIGKMYTKSDLAFYDQGYKFPQLIVTNVNASIGSVLFPVASKFQDDSAKVKKITRTSIRVSSYIMWPLMIGMAAAAEPFIRLLLTAKWLSCVPYLRIFCFSFALWPIHTANLQAINAVGRSDIFLRLEVVKKTIGILFLLVSMPFGILVIVLSMLVTGFISTFINSAPNKNLLNYTYKEQVIDLGRPFLLAVFMGIIVYLVTLLHLSDWLTLCIQVIVGVIVYILISILFKDDSFRYLLGIVQSTLKSRLNEN